MAKDIEAKKFVEDCRKNQNLPKCGTEGTASGVFLKITENKNKLDFETYFEKELASNLSVYGDINSIIREARGGQIGSLRIIKGNKIDASNYSYYYFLNPSGTNAFVVEGGESKATFDQILSTFTFLDQNQTGIVSASSFSFRQFDPKQVPDYPNEILAIPDDQLVKMRCTEVYGRIGGGVSNPLSKDTLIWITEEEMESIFKTLDSKTKAEGKYLGVMKMCEAVDGRKIVIYDAGEIYIGEFKVDGSIPVKTTIKPTSGPHYACNNPLAFTKENVLYFMCGSADGASSSYDYLRIDLQSGLYTTILHCSSTLDENGKPKTSCQ